MIFKALGASDSVYLHDLVGYFTQHRVACTLSQLHCLLQPFMSEAASITLSEFQKFGSLERIERRFAASLTMDADRRLSEAFPGTFGRSTHISLSLGERSLA